MANEPVLACNMHAIAPAQREQHIETAKFVYKSALEVQALPDGYAFRLPATTEILLKAAEYISNERLCCSFFHFSLDIEPNGGAFWLRLTGGEMIPAFILAEGIGTLLNAEVAKAAGILSVSS